MAHSPWTSIEENGPAVHINIRITKSQADLLDTLVEHEKAAKSRSDLIRQAIDLWVEQCVDLDEDRPRLKDAESVAAKSFVVKLKKPAAPKAAAPTSEESDFERALGDYSADWLDDLLDDESDSPW